ncbi:SusD/RagB family nutrient-binding outer membrane lipoprotein [Algivirga pacifica]
MKKIFRNIFIAAAFLAATSSCESLVSGEEFDPNQPADAPANLILPAAELANAMFHESDVARLAGMWSGYFTGADRQYVGLNNYVASAADFDATWGIAYQGVMQQTSLVIAKAEGINDRATAGVAKIVQANTMGSVTSLWGDVPFSQAAQSDVYPNPEYDAQADVYAALQALLDEAIADIEAQGAAASIYNTGNWVEVAYTLKARYFMHVGDYASAYAAAQKGISDVANNLMVDHGDNINVNTNVFWTFLEWERAGYMTADNAYAVSLLNGADAMYRGNAKTDEGARLNYLYSDEQWYSDEWEPNSHPSFWGGKGNGFFDIATSFPLVTMHENVLILAEAASRNNDFTAALGHLNDYRAYMNAGGYIHADYHAEGLMYEAYDAADFQAGGMAAVAGFTAEESLLQEIMEERYLAFVGQVEGFNDLRRTADDKVGVKPTPVTGAELPKRFIYSQDEVNSNENTPEPLGVFEATPVNQ